ncbi:MAG: Rpn family recombination-promoting nuclease/putative transposase [Treponema sp.]|nr:Rpn family recombination-promoting nuclease/putative transposase [Treponema sp.]MEE3434675.1 Rpn family recombination-promoting nuclease/putative transposase [Treponema sp.]
MNESQKALTPQEKWERATIANNFIFYKVMRNNPDVCKELLEILLEFKIERIEMSQEEVVDIDFASKGIRMDVYARDADGLKAYNIEMQTTDTEELPERARYYQGVMDVDLLKSGQQYKELKTTYIIFICLDDIFKKGLAKYTFENLCLEDGKTKLNDRTQKVFYICKNYDKLLDTRQKAFLRMVTQNSSSDDFTRRVGGLVENAKRNTQWRQQFMEWDREMACMRAKGREEGLAEGARQNAIENARSFYANGASLELIAKSLNMTVKQVKEIVCEPDATPAEAN